MSRYFFIELQLDGIKIEKPEVLRKMDSILFSKHENTCFNMPSEELDTYIANFLESRIHGGLPSLNLLTFLEKFTDINVDDLPQDVTILPSHIISFIIKHKEEIVQNINHKCK